MQHRPPTGCAIEDDFFCCSSSCCCCCFEIVTSLPLLVAGVCAVVVALQSYEPGTICRGGPRAFCNGGVELIWGEHSVDRGAVLDDDGGGGGIATVAVAVVAGTWESREGGGGGFANN